MYVRNRRGKARTRIAVAAAVLAGAAAIGVVVVATDSHPAPSTVQSAGFSSSLASSRELSVGTALSTALSDWTRSPQKSLTALAEMAPVKDFATVRHGKTVLAVQRGVVVLATKHWLLVKSANGSLHLWLVNGATKTKNVAGSVAGLTALTASKAAAIAATRGNTSPAAAVLAGTSTVAALNNPAPKRATFSVAVPGSGGKITITITPSTTTIIPSSRTVARLTDIPVTGIRQPTFAATDHVRRGDLVLVAGVEKQHHQLLAQLVLFTAPAKATAKPAATPKASATVSGTHS